MCMQSFNHSVAMIHHTLSIISKYTEFIIARCIFMYSTSKHTEHFSGKEYINRNRFWCISPIRSAWAARRSHKYTKVHAKSIPTHLIDSICIKSFVLTRAARSTLSYRSLQKVSFQTCQLVKRPLSRQRLVPAGEMVFVFSVTCHR